MPSSDNQASPRSPSSGTIVLCLPDTADRRVLAEWLDERHDVLAADSDTIRSAAFDLCIVDDESLTEYRTVLTERKEREQPVLLPYLLVTRRQDEAASTPQVQRLVDELLIVPTTKTKLGWRVENLLNRRKLSGELRRSKERFRLLFQGAPDPVVAVSSNGRISNVNEAFYDEFGFEEGELVETPFADLEFVTREPDEDTDANENTRTLYWELDDGSSLIMSLHINEVDFGGSVTEYIGIFRDITSSTERIERLEREEERLQGLHWSRE